jgi:hypothetical protein
MPEPEELPVPDEAPSAAADAAGLSSVAPDVKPEPPTNPATGSIPEGTAEQSASPAVPESADAATDSAARAAADPTGQVFVAADDAPPVTDDDDDDRPSTLRTATVVSARIVLGVVALAAVGIVVAAAILLPLPALRAHPVSRIVTPTATTQQLVCPGGLLRFGSSTGANATSASALGSARVTSGTVSGAVSSSDFAVTDAGTGRTAAAPRLLSIPAAPTGSAPARLSGAQFEELATTEFSGLSSAGCTAPSEGTWLAGGSTSVGRTTLLLLANPTAVTATVSVQVFGEVGQVTAPGMDGIQVSPGAQRVLSIAGFAPNVVSPVVHVTSTGGEVAAVLEQTTVRGLVPGGADFVGGQAAPATTNVIPGVAIVGSAAVQAQIGQSGYDDLQTTLRLFAPGAKVVTASVTIIAEDGTATGKPTTTKIPGGRVTDVSLDSLSDGNYTIVVTSTSPLVASVRASTAGATSGTLQATPSTDFAWMTSAPLLTSSALVSVPFASGASGADFSSDAAGSSGSSGSSDGGPGTSNGPNAPLIAALLHLENPTSQPETVRVAALDGSHQTITVAAKSATSVTVSPGTTYQLSGFSHLYASVSGTDGGGVTSFVVSPPAPGEGAVRIYG